MDNKQIDLTEHLDELLSLIIGCEGDIALAIDRFHFRRDENIRITEYEVLEALAALDAEYADRFKNKLQTVLAIRLFGLIAEVTTQLRTKMEYLRPAELARTHSSLVNSFSTLTAGSKKITFDFDSEAAKIAAEFDVSPDEVKADIKSMQQRLETGFGKSGV